MNSCVIDSSALMAVLRIEPGADRVTDLLPESCISSVNYAEVIGKLCEDGVSLADARMAIELTGVEIIPFDADQAAMAGELRPLTRSLGLSLGDRACLALAKSRGVSAMTADRAWAGLKGFDVKVIR